MNKILNYTKYILYIACFILIFIFIKKYNVNFKDDSLTKVSYELIIMLSLLFITFIMNILDLIKFKIGSKVKGYNILSIIDLLSLIVILIITCYSNFIISNPLRNYANGYYNMYGYKYFIFYANFISLLLIINIIYYIVNAKKTK